MVARFLAKIETTNHLQRNRNVRATVQEETSISQASVPPPGLYICSAVIELRTCEDKLVTAVQYDRHVGLQRSLAGGKNEHDKPVHILR